MVKDYDPDKRGENARKAVALYGESDVTPQSDEIWETLLSQVKTSHQVYLRKRAKFDAPVQQLPQQVASIQLPPQHEPETINVSRPPLGYQRSNDIWNSKPEIVAKAKYLYQHAESSGMPLTEKEHNYIYPHNNTDPDGPKMNEHGQCIVPYLSPRQFGLLDALCIRLEKYQHKASLQ